MKDTVFVPAFGNRPRNLVGREDIIRIFEESLDSMPGSRERAMLILGQRGSGKTVLLLELAEMARSRGMVVAAPTIVSKKLPERILEKLITDGEAHLKKPRTKVSGGSLSVFGFGGGISLASDSQPARSFSWQLQKLCTELNKNGKPVLILVDEVQANSEELRQLIIAYQEMVGEGKDVFLVMAGLPMSISSVLNDHVLTFLNRAGKVDLPPLKVGDIETYYRNVFQKLSVRLPDGSVSKAAEETAGSPYLMQLIGHYLVLAADENGSVSNKQYTDAIQRAKTDYMNDICQTTLAPLSEKDRMFLSAMAQDSGASAIADIIFRLGWSDSAVQIYKRRLIQAGVIEQHRRGAVRFAVPYLRSYLLDSDRDSL